MTPEDHVRFDVLPTEIYHQVGAFLFDNSFSAEPTESSLSAVYFYFYLLSLLNSHMYYRVHASEFWQYDKIQIVLRNKEMFNRSLLMQEQAPTRQERESTRAGNENEGEIVEEESEAYPSLSHVQFKCLYELIRVCQFSSIQFVGLKSRNYAVFIHDLLRKLMVCDPEILNNLQSLSIHCTVVDFECLGNVLRSCEQLKEFRLFFVVGNHLNCKFITSSEHTQEGAKMKSNNSIGCASLETIQFHLSSVRESPTLSGCEFLINLCENAPNVRSLSIRSLSATKKLLSALGKNCKRLEYFSFIALSSYVDIIIDNDTVLEMIKGWPKISALVLEHFMIDVNQLIPCIVDTLKDSLRYLKVQLVPLNSRDSPTTPLRALTNHNPTVLEEVVFSRKHRYGHDPILSIGDICGNRCVRSFHAPGCCLKVRDYELHLFSRMQRLSFVQLSKEITFSQFIGACTHLRQLSIQETLSLLDTSAILMTCRELSELSISCNSDIVIPTILQLQPENLKKLILVNGRPWEESSTNPKDNSFYGHINLEEFNYTGSETQYLLMMFEHCPKLHTFQCGPVSPSFEMICRHYPNIRSVTVPFTSVTFPHRMSRLKLLHTGYSYRYQKSEINAVEAMMAFIHCPSIVSLQIADFWKSIGSLVESFTPNLEECHGEDAPVGVACRFIIEKLATSAFEKSEGLSSAEREQAKLSIERCLTMYCDNNCTDDVLFDIAISDSGIELHLRRLIALIRLKYEKFQEERLQLGFLFDD